MAFSADGQMMAWSNMASVKVAQEEGGKWSIKFELQQPKVFQIEDGDPLAFFHKHKLLGDVLGMVTKGQPPGHLGAVHHHSWKGP